MPSPQSRELLAEYEVFEKQPARTEKKSDDCDRQDSQCVYHV
jgi:hypothetical protein